MKAWGRLVQFERAVMSSPKPRTHMACRVRQSVVAYAHGVSRASVRVLPSPVRGSVSVPFRVLLLRALGRKAIARRLHDLGTVCGLDEGGTGKPSSPE